MRVNEVKKSEIFQVKVHEFALGVSYLHKI